MKPLLIVDGYNVIGAWKDAAKYAWSIDESRDRLMHQLMDYGGYTGEEVVLVFDGYQSDKRTTTQEQHGMLTLVFTKHGETADSYIERYVAQLPKYRIARVATSDGVEQAMVLGSGATRMTSRELLRELKQMRQAGFDAHSRPAIYSKNSLAARLPADVQEALERLRRGQ
ncbi:MAG: NYN domain-containing protein [Clostridia bacterium]|nr:NYN domain-containing protein [Clostridia bacterium]